MDGSGDYGGLIMKVYVVRYSPGEPDGVYTLCVCATEDRAETEMLRYDAEEGINMEYMHIEEEEVLE